jgi:hypothetical protein
MVNEGLSPSPAPDRARWPALSQSGQGGGKRIAQQGEQIVAVNGKRIENKTIRFQKPHFSQGRGAFTWN